LPNHIHLLIEICNKEEKLLEPITGLAPLKKGSISSFINLFKGHITRFANEHKIDFEWQRRFNDRIVRDEKEYQNVKLYIQNNIANWKIDIEKEENIC
jgi:putative transposase